MGSRSCAAVADELSYLAAIVADISMRGLSALGNEGAPATPTSALATDDKDKIQSGFMTLDWELKLYIIHVSLTESSPELKTKCGEELLG